MDLCHDLLQHTREYYAPAEQSSSFQVSTLSYVDLLFPSLIKLSFIRNATWSNYRAIWMTILLCAQFGLISVQPDIIAHIYYPRFYAGYVVSVRRRVMDRIVVLNRPADPCSTQGSHWPISFMRTKHRTRANGLPWNLWNWALTNHIQD